MLDLYHYWGGDLAISSTGDLALANDTTTGQQRVLRRLLTNPALVDDSGNVTATADYTFHQDYGAGLPRQVGQPADIPQVQAVIAAQLLQEAAVSNTPAPIATVTAINDGINALIQYNDAATQTPVVLNFDVTK